MEITIHVPTVRELFGQWKWLLVLALIAFSVVLPQADVTTAVGTIEAVDGPNQVGTHSSLALDAAGNPVVSYWDETTDTLKIVHCNDPNCTGGDESITSPDPASGRGRYNSLALDPGGLPVVSYLDLTNTNLIVLHCGNPNCTAGNNIRSFSGANGSDTSLAIDASGNPVVAYTELSGNAFVRLLHCGNPTCTAANSITNPDTTAIAQFGASMVLDASGYPIIVYDDQTNDVLRLVHCNEVNCAGGNESHRTVDAISVDSSSVTIQAVNPIIAYRDISNDDLKVLRRGDPNCTAIASTTTVDSSGNTGFWPSIALDSSNFPVISYVHGGLGQLKIMHCNDFGCTGGDESIEVINTNVVAGPETSMELDANGYPVVSFAGVLALDDDLMVLHCTDVDCAGPSGSITITSQGLYDLPKTCYEVRDESQVALFTVCDNDFQGAPDSHAACRGDGVCEDELAALGLVRVSVTKGNYNVVSSNVPFQHTSITAKQSCNAGVCSLTFYSEPDIRPWFPWDINGDTVVNIPGDILGVAGMFGEVKPTPTPGP